MKHIYYGKYNSKPIPYSVKIIILWLLIYDSPIKGTCGGFSTWDQKTPYGNEFRHEDINDKSSTFILCNANFVNDTKVIDDLFRWYFYKDYICGVYYKKQSEAFFIFDEKNCQLQVYDDKLLFQKDLRLKKLIPHLWTRWYDSFYGFILTEGDFGQGAISLFFIFPIIVIVLLTTVIGLIVTKFNLKHTFNKVTFAIIFIIFIRIILDIYPQSI